jgi:hypothetical protein
MVSDIDAPSKMIHEWYCIIGKKQGKPITRQKALPGTESILIFDQVVQVYVRLGCY